ncbi:MAG: hypothetical protein ACXVBV_12440, partial [Isosphaeraceae bacterium]
HGYTVHLSGYSCLRLNHGGADHDGYTVHLYWYFPLSAHGVGGRATSGEPHHGGADHDGYAVRWRTRPILRRNDRA